MDDGVPIRAISRGLAVLQAVNRMRSISLMQISRATQIPYPTVCRIVQTLLFEGMIEREPTRKRYRPTLLVKALASGFQEDDRLVKAARPHMVELTRRTHWPIALATRVGNKMVLRDSTHSLTTLTLSNYYPGYTLPIAECSTGKVYLAYCDEEERAMLREGSRLSDFAPDKLTLLFTENDAMIRRIRREGYATHARNAYTAVPGRTSSISVPILAEDAMIAGSMALTFFSSAMKMAEAEARFVDDLKATAARIAADFARLSAPERSAARVAPPAIATAAAA